MSDNVDQATPSVEYEHHVRINYKSGNSFTGWFSVFDYTHKNDQIESITATHCDGQKLLIIGLRDIESIVKLESREVPVKVEDQDK